MKNKPKPVGKVREKAAASGTRYFWVVNFVFLIVVVAVALHWGDWHVLIKLLTQIKPKWLAAAILLQIGTYVCVTTIWRVVLKSCGISISIANLFALSLAKLFSDQTVPSFGISGSVVAMRGFIRRKSSSSAAAAAVLMNTVSRYLPYFLFFNAGMAIVWKNHMLNNGLQYLALIFAALLSLLSAIVIALMGISSHKKVPRFLQRVRKLEGFFKTLQSIPRETFKNAPVWFLAFGANAAIFLLDSSTLWALLASLGTWVPLSHAFACFMISSVVTDLAIIPGRLGVFEGSSIALLHLFNVPIEQAVAAIVLFRGVTYWLPMIPGFIITRREFRKI